MNATNSNNGLFAPTGRPAFSAKDFQSAKLKPATTHRPPQCVPSSFIHTFIPLSNAVLYRVKATSASRPAPAYARGFVNQCCVDCDDDSLMSNSVGVVTGPTRISSNKHFNPSLGTRMQHATVPPAPRCNGKSRLVWFAL